MYIYKYTFNQQLELLLIIFICFLRILHPEIGDLSFLKKEYLKKLLLLLGK
jgi:hypothetical protein